MRVFNIIYVHVRYTVSGVVVSHVYNCIVYFNRVRIVIEKYLKKLVNRDFPEFSEPERFSSGRRRRESVQRNAYSS